MTSVSPLWNARVHRLPNLPDQFARQYDPSTAAVIHLASTSQPEIPLRGISKIMNDKLPPLVTPIVPPSQPIYSIPTDASIQNDASRQEAVEEEPYTIKCICTFPDDDGNTIYCDRCDTWQHMECYYPNNSLDQASLEKLAHYCVDCKPRNLDGRQATERQRSRTTIIPSHEEETADKKIKRPPSKSHKKKPKPSDLQINSHATGTDSSKHGSPHDHQPPAKKFKNSHKASQSISSQAPAPKRSPSYGSARNGQGQGHPPSPATTPSDLPEHFEIHSYSSGFLDRCRNRDVKITEGNSYSSLQIATTMSDWLRESGLFHKEVGLRREDILRKLPTDVGTSNKIVPRFVEIQPTRIEGQTIQSRCLKASSTIAKGALLMELNGVLRFQSQYCEDPANRWDEFSSPLPFVFFLPKLPLCIDTRREGSMARYVRPSCKPNAQLETFLWANREYSFWIVSDREIPANQEVTIPWDFRFSKSDGPRWYYLLGLGDEDPSPSEANINENEYASISGWIHRVLSEYGGCACNLGKDCAFTKFHRTYHKGFSSKSQPAAKKKARKSKTQHTISPTSTGHATNSRAASEGHLDDAPENDRRSVSGSSRSKPPSRDMTPVARQGSLDTIGILTEPTDRDKRKVAMVEDTFRRMEQQQPPKKKKRTSDGPAASNSARVKIVTSSAAQTPNHVDGPSERRFVDAGTSRSKSGSPAHAVSPNMALNTNDPQRREEFAASAASRSQSGVSANPSYCDAVVQTDPEEHPWYDGVISHAAIRTPTPKKRRVFSLSKRLLNHHREKKLELEKRGQQRTLGPRQYSTSMDVDGPEDPRPARSLSTSRDTKRMSAAASPNVNMFQDTVMPDEPMVSSSMLGQAWPAPSAPVPVKIPSPELRVQLPPVPAFHSQNSAVSAVSTPLSSGGPVAQTPLSAVGLQTSCLPGFDVAISNPSPVKKKMSLSDYRQQRQKKEAAGANPPNGPTALRPPEEPRSASSIKSSVPLDSPIAERPVASDASVSLAAASTTSAQS